MRYWFRSRFNWFDVLAMGTICYLVVGQSWWWFFAVIPAALISAIGEDYSK